MLGSADEKQRRWLELVAGRKDLVISVAAYNGKTVSIGPVSPSCDVQLDGGDCSGGCMTLASIKQELEAKHGIKWSDPDFNYHLRKLRDDRAAELLEDDSESLDFGTSLMLFPANPKQMLLLPPVLVPLPPENMDIDGTRAIPINVKSRDSDRECYLDLLLPMGCTVLHLRHMLYETGIRWAMDGAKVLSFSNKLMKNDAVIPASCDLPLKVVETTT